MSNIGDVSVVAVGAPAGGSTVAPAGVTGAVAVRAVVGTAGVGPAAPTGTVAVAAPAGSLYALGYALGVAGAICVSAPAGLVSVSQTVAGPVGTVSVASPSGGAVVVPPPPPNRWRLYDPVLAQFYDFTVNPSDGGVPALTKTFAYQSLGAPDGGLVLHENQDPMVTLQFSGSILAQAEYDTLVAWFATPHTVWLVDDLGVLSTVYITAFTPTRVRSAGNPWYHTYTVDALLLKAGV